MSTTFCWTVPPDSSPFKVLPHVSCEQLLLCSSVRLQPLYAGSCFPLCAATICIWVHLCRLKLRSSFGDSFLCFFKLGYLLVLMSYVLKFDYICFLVPSIKVSHRSDSVIMRKHFDVMLLLMTEVQSDHSGRVDLGGVWAVIETYLLIYCYFLSLMGACNTLMFPRDINMSMSTVHRKPVVVVSTQTTTMTLSDTGATPV